MHTDLANPPFPVRCDMALNGGGWTLVAYEPAESPLASGVGSTLVTGALASLWLKTGTAEAIAQGTGAGLIGSRFPFAQGLYTHVRLNWCDPGVDQNLFADGLRAANGAPPPGLDSSAAADGSGHLGA